MLLRPAVLALLLPVVAAPASAQVAPGLLDVNTAPAAEILALPGVSPALGKSILEKRPFASVTALHALLTSGGLTPEQASALYDKAFVHVNLDTGSAEEFLLIPRAGKKMAHEFEEYRPWKSWAQFDKEIGKYVGPEEVQRLKRYLFIPLDLNTASEADFMTIPGVGKKMAHELQEYRPWKSQAQFEKEIGKYVDAKEVARIWRYVTIR